jgi:hypothetical protein
MKNRIENSVLQLSLHTRFFMMYLKSYCRESPKLVSVLMIEYMSGRHAYRVVNVALVWVFHIEIATPQSTCYYIEVLISFSKMQSQIILRARENSKYDCVNIFSFDIPPLNQCRGSLLTLCNFFS